MTTYDEHYIVLQFVKKHQELSHLVDVSHRYAINFPIQLMYLVSANMNAIHIYLDLIDRQILHVVEGFLLKKKDQINFTKENKNQYQTKIRKRQTYLI
jgi:hypothetical protein